MDSAPGDNLKRNFDVIFFSHFTCARSNHSTQKVLSIVKFYDYKIKFCKVPEVFIIVKQAVLNKSSIGSGPQATSL